MDTAWVRDIRDQCVEEEVAFYFKQWGECSKSATGANWTEELGTKCPTLKNLRLGCNLLGSVNR